jgi:CRP-like cAMP-binding protein
MLVDKIVEVDRFSGMAESQIRELSQLAVPCTFKQDELVFDQDEYAAYLYIIVDGEIVIRFKPYDGPPINVATIGDGGVFGWSSVLGRAVYTSAAICSQDTSTIRFLGRDLQRLCETYPDTGIIIMERLAAVIADRLSRTNEQILKMLSHNLDTNGECMRRRSDENGKS